MEKQTQHTRENDSLLGPIEIPALKWLSAHMPKTITPNMMTVLGVIASVIIFFSYWMTVYSSNFLWLASFGLVLNWFGDSLDGNLARFRHIEKPKFGFFIDHTVDTLSEILIGVGIGLSPYVRLDFALLAIISYLLMSVFVYITTYVKGVFKISYSKVGPTEIRLMLITANTFIYFAGNLKIELFIIRASIYDTLAILISLTLFCLYVTLIIKQGIELSKLENKSN